MTVSIRLSQQTAVILDVIATAWHVRVEEVIEQAIMRDAATMSGWPGDVGVRCRHALVELFEQEANDARLAAQVHRFEDTVGITPF